MIVRFRQEFHLADQLHAAAVEHMPPFITAPGETDVLMVVTAIFLGVCVVAFGILYFRLHALPEHIAHKGQKVQFEIVAVLGLIALFTHMHIFWIAALLLAFIDLPDFGNFLARIAGSVERIAGVKLGQGAEGVAATATPEPAAKAAAAGHDGGESATTKKPTRAMSNREELDHA